MFRLHYQHCTSPSDCTWNSLEWWKQNVLSWTWTFFATSAEGNHTSDSMYKQAHFIFSAIEKTWGWKRKIKKWDGFHQQCHYCPSAAEPRKWNPNKINVSYTPRWSSTWTSWKGFSYFYKVPLAPLKVFTKTCWYGLISTSQVHSYKKISRYSLWLSIVLKIC